jgi:hypothetical protein
MLYFGAATMGILSQQPPVVRYIFAFCKEKRQRMPLPPGLKGYIIFYEFTFSVEEPKLKSDLTINLQI